MSLTDRPVVLLGPLPLAAFKPREGAVICGPVRALAGGRGGEHVQRAESRGFPRAASPLAKAIAGMLLDLPGGDLVVPVPGTLTDHRAALTALPETWRPHLLSLSFGDPAACAAGIEGAGGAPHRTLSEVSVPDLETILREQQRGARSSATMARWLRELWEPGQAPDPGPAESPGDRQPLLALGPWTLFEDLPRRVEDLGARIVWDEEGAQGAYLARALRPADALARWPALEPARRTEAIIEAVARTRAAGVILVMEAFTGALLDELLLRKHLRIPMLALEAEAPGPLDPARRLRLETFIRLVAQGRGRSG